MRDGQNYSKDFNQAVIALTIVCVFLSLYLFGLEDKRETGGRFFCPEKLTYRGRGGIRTPPSFWGVLDRLEYIHYNDNRQFSYLCK